MDSSPSSPRPEMTSSTLYPKIGKLKDLLYEVRKLDQTSFDLLGTVKLHGTHADIVIDSDNNMRFQSRNRPDLNPTIDNVGFAAFANPLRQRIFALRNAFVARYRTLNPNIPFSSARPVVIAGEWCGSNIQKKVALMNLPKQFVIISIQINGSWVLDDEYGDVHDESIGIYNISRAGFFHTRLDVQDTGSLEAEINTLVEQVEKECPYARSFGMSGMGEGIVWKIRDHASNPEFWFKSKGEMFAVTERAKLPRGAGDDGRAECFAVAIVSQNRLEQGWDYLGEMRVARDMKGMGRFLQWVMDDCLKEEKRDMEEADIKEQNLKPAITNIAKPWYKAKVESSV